MWEAQTKYHKSEKGKAKAKARRDKLKVEKAAYDKEYYRKNKTRKDAASINYYYTNREKWRTFIQSLGFDHCVKCEYDKCWDALDFHHKSEKTFNVANFLSKVCNKANRDILKAELEKCIMLCANCHRELHAEERRTPS
jgi:hypothetical protein